MNKKINKWLKKNINDDLKNKTIFISGGHSGIGLATSKICASYCMNLIWGARNNKKAEENKKILLKEYPDIKIEIVELDLANFKSIENCANSLTKFDIDYVYNNAGVYRVEKSYTSDGIDLTIGTNFVGTYYFNKLLLEKISKINKPVKFIFTTSLVANFHHLNYQDFFLEKHYKKVKAYCLSKRMTYHIYQYFKNEYANSNLSFAIVHPGSTYTPLIEKGYKSKALKKISKSAMKILFHSPESAALNAMYCLTHNTDNYLICPRGFIHISGLPKKAKVKKTMVKNYDFSIMKANEVLTNYKNNN